jgi:hypothetical protein
LITAKTGLAPEQRNCKIQEKRMCVGASGPDWAPDGIEGKKERKMDRGQS